MNKITIDRAVVEQAMKAMLNFPGDISDEMFESIRALRAALAEPAQEPVAWRFEARHIDTAWGPAVSLKRPGPEHKYMRNVIPLYAAPPHQKQVGWMQKSTGVIRCDWGFDKTGYVPVYAVQEQSE
jgi:hypothetical protein